MATDSQTRPLSRIVTPQVLFGAMAAGLAVGLVMGIIHLFF